jgi:hypothetical protein
LFCSLSWGCSGQPFARRPGSPPFPLPGPGQPRPPATHLAYLSFPDQAGDAIITIARRLAANGHPQAGVPPLSLFSQPVLADCQTDGLHVAPNGRHLVIQYNCHHNLFIHLLKVAGPHTIETATLHGSHFLDWSPDGHWLLLWRLPDERIWLVAVNGSEEVMLDLPAKTYDAAFTSDGQSLVYMTSAGLGFGSEIGRLDLATGNRTTWRTFPYQIVTYPRWSPNGEKMAYILMPDTNVPFTVGELWLAGTTAEPLIRLDEADAGHGYPPVWSPNGHSVAYVRRQNPDSVTANHVAEALHSNIFRAGVDGTVTQLTHFAASRVFDPAWSPDSQFTDNQQ